MIYRWKHLVGSPGPPATNCRDAPGRTSGQCERGLTYFDTVYIFVLNDMFCRMYSCTVIQSNYIRIHWQLRIIERKSVFRFYGKKNIYGVTLTIIILLYIPYTQQLQTKNDFLCIGIIQLTICCWKDKSKCKQQW